MIVRLPGLAALSKRHAADGSLLPPPIWHHEVHAAYIVLKILHVVSMRVIITASIIAFGLDLVLYLHQDPSYNYWARFMPGIGTDMSLQQR